MSFTLPRPPETDDELWWCLKAMFGVEIPRVSVCPDHVSPFEALAHAYFGKEPNFAVWYASRGSGKSLALAVLGLAKAFIRDIDVTILGGSMTQSLNVRMHMKKLMAHPNAPGYAVAKDQATLIQMRTGKTITPLPASQTTVRGPHPSLQLLDEVDEMEWEIYNASLGQAMEQKNAHGENVLEYIVASSTWQNPEGCVKVGTLIPTDRGTIPIQNVRIGDLVPTRKGWRKVTNSIDTGKQETVTVQFESGRSLVCTPWHPIWTISDGFVQASLLAPGSHVGVHMVPMTVPIGSSSDEFALMAPVFDSTFPVGPDNSGTFDGQIMPMVANGLGSFGDEHSLVVDLRGDNLQVPQVDAATVKTLEATRAVKSPQVAEMIKMHVVGDGADQLLPDPAMSYDNALRVTTVGLDPVAVLHDTQRPRDALVGVEIDGYVFAHDKVVHVTNSTMVLPTWDLTVEDCHEYVAGGILVHNTFTQVIENAREKGMPVFTWCWRELLEPNGWMSQRFIDNKRKTVSAQMWHTEYDLNEPSAGSRAFDLDKVERYFINYPKPIEEIHKGNGDHDVYIWEKPVANGLYAVGADWAKEQDKTVIAVMRYDIEPHRMVKLTRINRRPWPVMIDMFNKDTQLYQAVAEHDGTGIGNVVNDYVDYSDTTNKFVMIGRKRTQMLLDYITAFEHGRYNLPLIAKDEENLGVTVNPLYRAHRAVTVADVYAPGKWNSHLPDDMAAMALCHRAIEMLPTPSRHDGTVPSDGSVRDVDARFHVKPEQDITVTEGGVTIVDERYGAGNDYLVSANDNNDPWDAGHM